MSKHKADPDCPVCSPEKAMRRKRIRDRKQGGYSPAPRCAAHQMKGPPVPPPGRGCVR